MRIARKNQQQNHKLQIHHPENQKTLHQENQKTLHQENQKTLHPENHRNN